MYTPCLRRSLPTLSVVHKNLALSKELHLRQEDSVPALLKQIPCPDHDEGSNGVQGYGPRPGTEEERCLVPRGGDLGLSWDSAAGQRCGPGQPREVFRAQFLPL